MQPEAEHNSPLGDGRQVREASVPGVKRQRDSWEMCAGGAELVFDNHHAELWGGVSQSVNPGGGNRPPG